ncbi:MAG: hypothetical protein GC200_09390 [Tepidisphaera sp.]|nr:hypothetical protein [Tepidisphaera sp.]
MSRDFRLTLRWAVLAASAMALAGCQTQTHAGRALEAGTSTGAVLPADIDRLTGPAWHGTLTYLDYTSNKPTTIRSGLLVTRLPDADSPAWTFGLSYDEEPKADQGSKVRLTDNGFNFDDAAVTERTIEPDGTVQITTEEDADDNHRPARLRHVLRIGEHECTWQKLVRPGGSAEFFERNIYRWTR